MNESVQDKIQQGIELMAAQRYEAAKDLFEEVLREDRGNYEAHFNLGNAQANLGEFEESAEDFKRALLARPDATEAMYSLACVYFLEGRYVDSVREFNRCEENGLTSVEMYQILETIFVDTKDYVQAIRYANKAIQLEPLNARHYIDKANLYLLREQPKEALACLREVEDLLPDAAEPYLTEAQILAQTGESDRALETMERALSRFPGDASLLVAKSRLLNGMGRSSEALEVTRRARELAGDMPEFVRTIDVQEAVALAALNDLDGSIAALERAVEADASSDQAMFMLITECAAAKRFDDVERHCDRVISGDLDVDDHTKAAAVFWKAAALKELGRAEDAGAAFREAVGVLRRMTIARPGLVEVYAYRIMCHKELGEFDKAADLADHIIELSPEDAVGYAFKADVMAAKGDKAQAEALRSKARSLNSSIKL